MISLVETNIKSRKRFVIACEIQLNHSMREVWTLITRPQHLELYHPFCKRHDFIEKYHLGAMDEAEFNSGLVKKREVVMWNEFESYTIKLHGKPEMNTLIHSKITPGNSEFHCRFSMTIESFAYKKIPRPIWPIMAKYFLVPSFQHYLSCLLQGIEFYLRTGQKVEKNQFGTHRKFSPR